MTDTDTTDLDAVQLPDDLPDLQLTGDPLDGLSVRELRVGNAKLRGDLVHAITTPTADRWDAMALMGWLHAKRLDPTAKLDPWLDLTAAQLSKALRYVAPQPADSDDVVVDQVDVVATATIDDVMREAQADPTDRTDGR
jgi:hypothetical protein